ncbi:Uncharacterised protein [Escherichia coli]|uniref:Uncharacterized protein n=1 Tax=Escherichia coli TaxID=562 RepID=A0A2X1K6W0_ECOLX|nr:Uncharacterised protein [Escherichia coli]
MNLNHLFDNPHADAAAVAKEGCFAVFVGHYSLLPVPQKITPGFIAVILSQMNGFSPSSPFDMTTTQPGYSSVPLRLKAMQFGWSKNNVCTPWGETLTGEN